ncbi:uncharacterized protein [Venturia canescens]|uniref:uncharacterized protein isoform X2 n=1 Tax=Venturia canescens TaxID=32260 RepID=UPI001C9C23AC|nr:uncharacterized protein LOC122412209 isoform X2 [Venturia canescens]
MTVHHRNEETREACFPTVSPSTKNHWPVMDNDSASWDRNSRATSSSWPGEMEEVATRKILQLWYAIERNIYGESEETVSSSQLSEECTQWKNQLLHLRLVGKGANSYLNEGNSNGTVRSNSRRSGTGREDRYTEEILMEDNVYRSKELSEDSRQHRLIEDQKEVFDQILEHVCNELVKQSDENKDSLDENLDEVLRIIPAPTYSGRKWTNGRKKRNNPDSRKSSANGNNASLKKSVEPTDVVSTEKNRLETDNLHVDETDVPPVARNKLGTVFNEKIVVSPVPFVVSSRESFTTLRTTPISFRAQHFKLASSEGELPAVFISFHSFSLDFQVSPAPYPIFAPKTLRFKQLHSPNVRSLAYFLRFHLVIIHIPIALMKIAPVNNQLHDQ